MTRSTIRGNQSTANVSQASGTGSSSVSGGGIFHVGALDQLLLDRSTVAGNSATANAIGAGGDTFAYGGGIHLLQNDTGPYTASVKSSTIANNSVSAGFASGANVNVNTQTPSSTFTSENTIIADGNGALNCAQDGAGPFLSLGYNLDSGDTCLGAGSTGDQENTNPQLGPLGPHGGPGLTMAPAINSPAVDKGTAAGAIVDQRGFQRTFDMNPVDAQDGTDIGAFEQVINGVTGSIPFGSQQWGTTSSTQDVVISNLTGNALSSGALSIAGTNPNDFQLSNDGCSTGSVPDNGTCTAKVAFSPVTPSNGARSATVTFGTFSPAFLVNLSGTTTGYTPAAIGVAPASKDFGSTQTGTPTAATEFVVNNTGLGTSGLLTVTLDRGERVRVRDHVEQLRGPDPDGRRDVQCLRAHGAHRRRREDRQPGHHRRSGRRPLCGSDRNRNRTADAAGQSGDAHAGHTDARDAHGPEEVQEGPEEEEGQVRQEEEAEEVGRRALGFAAE